MKRPKLKVDLNRLGEFDKACQKILLLRKCLGWNAVDQMLFMPLVPKKGGKRLRKKRARRLRLMFLVNKLKEAGMYVVQN